MIKNRKKLYFLIGILFVVFSVFFQREEKISKDFIGQFTLQETWLEIQEILFSFLDEGKIKGDGREEDTTLYKVKNVVDGDTVKVFMNDKVETVRLIGINTPETVDPRKEVECFGKEASEKVKELLAGKSVRLEIDTTQSERDKYKRLLRYVYLEDGTLLNLFLIKEGYAYEYTYESNPYKYQKDFKEASLFARKEKKGLWNENVCNGDIKK
ncbi:MAG: thermonuclease family protein [Candidatus Moraniibacteriota bacterium]|nr:MAG: thermonuclease family protein [Candidatus Moranbacteria bacterium]